MKKRKNKNSNLKRLLEGLFSETPEADPDAIYGQYLFAPKRKDITGSVEKNTTAEDDLYHALYSWYDGSKSQMRKMAPVIKREIDKGNYENILQPDGGGIAYRLISGLDAAETSKILGIPESKVIDSNGNPVLVGGGTLNPTDWSPLQSWTTSLDVDHIKNLLKTTDQNELPRRSVALLLSAFIDDSDFIINPDSIDNIDSLPHYAYKEKETISIGSVEVSKVVFVYNPNLHPIDMYKVIEDMIRMLH